jgi:hypothetical protein
MPTNNHNRRRKCILLFQVSFIDRSIAQNIQRKITESEARGHWIVGIAGSNFAEGIDVRLLCLLCVV